MTMEKDQIHSTPSTSNKIKIMLGIILKIIGELINILLD